MAALTVTVHADGGYTFAVDGQVLDVFPHRAPFATLAACAATDAGLGWKVTQTHGAGVGGAGAGGGVCGVLGHKKAPRRAAGLWEKKIKGY